MKYILHSVYSFKSISYNRFLCNARLLQGTITTLAVQYVCTYKFVTSFVLSTDEPLPSALHSRASSSCNHASTPCGP